MREKVEQTIEAIRPAIQADGGDIHLQDVDEETGVVTVELVGACVSCPASTVTLKAGIERILKDRVEGVTSVINQGDELFEGTPALAVASLPSGPLRPTPDPRTARCRPRRLAGGAGPTPFARRAGRYVRS